MIFDPILDIFRGKAVTIPPLDGAFRPNTRLDEAAVWTALSEIDNLAVRDGKVLATSGNALFQVDAGSEPALLQSLPAPITALAVSPSGEIAVGLETGRLAIGGHAVEAPAAINCITALAFDKEGALWLANGSVRHSPSSWSADLMEKGSSGAIWKRDAGAAAFREIASGLAFPYGLHVESNGAVVVSESWRHRLVRIDSAGNRSAVVDHLPGYPARLSKAADGGAWLSVFAPRNRLIEFVLQENHYRHDMMAQVPQDYWIAPALSSGRSFLEPLQCGAIKTMGIHKPWSPSRSHGMVVKLDARLQPVFAMHSRANGTRHGTCSAVEHGGTLLVGSKGGDCILSIDTAEGP
ncbi:hypothetical protein QO002_005152 [Pararhizobium capsulatum DSM 1112]|uniref:Strictosidine synthase n=1 Tax=Pararhizobium capsulatum DSM 1112 TaxID=1121113 RepID=A0ABU0BXF7_9HYPH|nr:hypothetical protein [Pararhizobium capsulatum]MDQ0322946.1 hypothetical protein [Pararhizobium capsulatum DSM 1112]